MLGCLVPIYRRGMTAAFHAVGLSGIAVAILSTPATVCYVSSLKRSAVAEVMSIAATGPLLSGGFAQLLIGEKKRRATILASVFALACVVVMVGPGAFGGHVDGESDG